MQMTDLLAAIGLGLAGAGHCIGMCGGIAVALRPTPNASSLMPLAYHLGRIVGYALLGGLIGSAAGAIELASWTIALRYLAGGLLIAMGLSVLNIWRGISWIERAGGVLWRKLQPLTKPLLPPKHLPQGLLLGMFWGFMPCGLIYSALAWSASAGQSAIDSALLMLLFGLGTVPAMLAVTVAGLKVEVWLRQRWVKQVIGVSLLLGGLWTAYHTFSHSDHLLGAHRGHSMQPGHSMEMPQQAPSDSATQHDGHTMPH